MALIPIKLTRRGRLANSLLSLILISLQGICGIIFLCIGSYIFFYIENGLISYTKDQLCNLVFFIITTSTTVFLVSSTGFKLITNLSAQPTNHSTTRLHWIWLLFSMAMVLFLIFFTLILPEIMEQLKTSLTLTLNHGLSHYYLHNSWKGMMNNLQQFHKCCGIQQYTDWYRMPWLNINDLPQDPDLLYKYAQANSLVIVPLVPSSCCKLPESVCGEKSLSSNKSTTEWNEIKPTDPTTIYMQGCLSIILSTLSASLLVLQVLLIVVITIQCFVMVISRYLITSTRNTILMGNPNGSASGWLFGRGDLCYDWGKTLPEHDSEIFKDFGNEGNEVKITEDEQSEDGKKSKITIKNYSAQENIKSHVRKRVIQTDDESDLTDYELQVLEKDNRIPERFQSKYMTTQRHDDISNAISMARLNTDGDCTECDEFAFGSEIVQYPKRLNKTPSDKKSLKSNKKTDEKTLFNEDSRGNVKQLPSSTLSNFGKQEQQVLFNINTESFILKNYDSISMQDQDGFKNESKNKLQSETSATENYNVQTQTSQMLFTQVQESVQTSNTNSDTTVFRNYKVLPK